MFTFGDLAGKPPAQVQKAAGAGSLTGRFKIQKADDDKHLAFGWANVSITENGRQIEDFHEDLIDPDELEQAAYQFVELYREGGEMHERGGCAVLIEHSRRHASGRLVDRLQSDRRGRVGKGKRRHLSHVQHRGRGHPRARRGARSRITIDREALEIPALFCL